MTGCSTAQFVPIGWWWIDTMNTQTFRLSVIILTFNEEAHIARAIASVSGIATSIYVVDSGSTDRTVEIASRQGAQILHNPWRNYATQFNWGLDELPQDTDWVLRLDADEIVTDQLRSEIATTLTQAPPALSGIFVPRRMCFLGRVIRHGGVSPIYVLRLFRRDKGRCEQRWMDEHIVVDGQTKTLESDLIDHNLKTLGWWTEKHNQYASREVIDVLNNQLHFLPFETIGKPFGKGSASSKRWIKEHIYNRIPGGIRALLYVIYRYVVRLGFLDGAPGLFFHFLQGFWYRLLVDAKLFEVLKYMKENDCPPDEAITNILGINLNSNAVSPPIGTD